MQYGAIEMLLLLYSPPCPSVFILSNLRLADIFEEGFNLDINEKGEVCTVFVFDMGAGYKIMDGCIW